MATLKELRDQIKIDAGLLGNNNFPDPRLNRMINLAQRYVQIQLNGLGMKKWETSITPTLSPSTYAGNTLATFSMSSLTNVSESPKSVLQIDCSDGTSAGIAREVSPDNFEEILQNTYSPPSVTQPRFMRLGGIVFIAPSTITTANVYYYKVVADMVADTDLTEIPMEFERFIISKAVNEIYRIQNKAAKSEGELDQEIQTAYEKFLIREKQEENSETLQ